MAFALACLYLAVMSGHLQSIDGLQMWRQGQSLAYRQSLTMQPPFWWGSWITESKYGLGLSLLYVPGLLLCSWLAPFVPQSTLSRFDARMLYGDPLWPLVGATAQAAVAAGSAYVIGRVLRELGADRPTRLWGMALFGVGSPALVYARADFAQPLAGWCWITAVWAAVRWRSSRRWQTALGCGLAVGYAVVTRPAEGMVVLPAVALLLLEARHAVRALVVVGTCVAVAGAVTLLVNLERFGNALLFGYGAEGWTTPVARGLAGLLFSPARGLLWAFPAVVLAPVGIVVLWRMGERGVAVALAAMPGMLLLLAAGWDIWWGGWNWGPRLLVPALPLLAVLAALGSRRVAPTWRRTVRTVLLVLGVVWAIPGTSTDLLGGYGAFANGEEQSWHLASFPPVGAWQFLQFPFATLPDDANVIDVLWVRQAFTTRGGSLLMLGFLLGTAAAVAHRSVQQTASRGDDAMSRYPSSARGEPSIGSEAAE